jgi:hypothetical protein
VQSYGKRLILKQPPLTMNTAGKRYACGGWFKKSRQLLKKTQTANSSNKQPTGAGYYLKQSTYIISFF